MFGDTMFLDALGQFLKLFNGKNISYAVLLCISLMCGYFVLDVVRKIMADNTVLIKSIDSADDNLKEILRVLKQHEEREHPVLKKRR